MQPDTGKGKQGLPELLDGWSFIQEGGANERPLCDVAAAATLPPPLQANTYNSPPPTADHPTTSAAIDGTWPTHDFVSPVEGGQGFCRRCLALSPPLATTPPTTSPTIARIPTRKDACVPATDDGHIAAADKIDSGGGSVPMLSREQVQQYFKNGFLELSGFYSAETVVQLQRWTEVLELYGADPAVLPGIVAKRLEVDAAGRQVPNRIENFMACSPFFRSLTRRYVLRGYVLRVACYAVTCCMLRVTRYVLCVYVVTCDVLCVTCTV